MIPMRARLVPLAGGLLRVMNIERDFDAIRRLLDDPRTHEPLVLVGATRRSIPLAVIAAHAGIVVGVLPRGATPDEAARVKSRGRPDRLHAFRDIAFIMSRESARARERNGNDLSSK